MNRSDVELSPAGAERSRAEDGITDELLESWIEFVCRRSSHLTLPLARLIATVDPVFAVRHGDYIHALNCMGQFDLVDEICRDATLMAPTDPIVASKLALASMWKKRDSEEPLRSLDRALAVNPDSREALYVRALLLVELGRDLDALADLEHLLELHPDCSAAADLLETVRYRFGQQGA